MGDLQLIPWAMAALAAVVFSFVAYRAGRSWPGWAIGWGFYGLVLSAWVAGLFESAHLPVNASDSALIFKTVLVSVLLILIPAAVAVWRLQPEIRQATTEYPMAPK